MLNSLGSLLRRGPKTLCKTGIPAHFRPHVLAAEFGSNIPHVTQQMVENRNALITHFVTHGTGIEIGALHFPTPLDADVKVLYVDYLSLKDLRKRYPELQDAKLVDPDIVDDGEQLSKVTRKDLDFVIANHFIEHCQNPILAIENMLSKLKLGGFIVMAVPDKRYTFDQPRKLTSFEHLRQDYEDGPELSRIEHYKDFSQATAHINARTPAQQFDYLMEHVADIHFHVWDHASFFDFIHELKKQLGFPIECVLYARNGFENTCILQKIGNLQAKPDKSHPLAIPDSFPRIWIDRTEPEQGAVLLYLNEHLWGSVFGFDETGHPRWSIFEKDFPGVSFDTPLTDVSGPAMGLGNHARPVKLQTNGQLSLNLQTPDAPEILIQGGSLPGAISLRPINSKEEESTGMWWDPSYAGQGIALSLSGADIWGVWFCFAEDGRSRWLRLLGQRDGKIGTLRLIELRRHGNSEIANQSIAKQIIGNAQLTFDAGTIEFQYQSEGAKGVLNLVPFVT